MMIHADRLIVVNDIYLNWLKAYNKNIINRQINLKKGTNNMKKTKQETTTAECSLLHSNKKQYNNNNI